MERPSPVAWSLVLGLLLITVGATAYEGLVAAGVLTPGPEPGEAPVGEGVAVLAGSLALVAGAVVCMAFLLRPRSPAERAPVCSYWSARPSHWSASTRTTPTTPRRCAERLKAASLPANGWPAW
jgi:hypothetical protein